MNIPVCKEKFIGISHYFFQFYNPKFPKYWEIIIEMKKIPQQFQGNFVSKIQNSVVIF